LKRGKIVSTCGRNADDTQRFIARADGDLESGALLLNTARYFTPSGRRSIQAKGISPNIVVQQDVPEELKARADTTSEATLRGHFSAEGQEQTASYVPPDPKNDKALHMALDLIRGTRVNPAFPPKPNRAAAD
jgi:carboxyl-terminal processing protease